AMACSIPKNGRTQTARKGPSWCPETGRRRHRMARRPSRRPTKIPRESGGAPPPIFVVAQKSRRRPTRNPHETYTGWLAPPRFSRWRKGGAKIVALRATESRHPPRATTTFLGGAGVVAQWRKALKPVARHHHKPKVAQIITRRARWV